MHQHPSTAHNSCTLSLSLSDCVVVLYSVALTGRPGGHRLISSHLISLSLSLSLSLSPSSLSLTLSYSLSLSLSLSTLSLSLSYSLSLSHHLSLPLTHSLFLTGAHTQSTAQVTCHKSTGTHRAASALSSLGAGQVRQVFVPSCFNGRRYAATRLTPSPFPSSHTARLGGAGGAKACTYFTYVFSCHSLLTEDLLRLPLSPQLMSVFEECSTNLAYTIIYQKCL